jgi:hypothetical protein
MIQYNKDKTINLRKTVIATFIELRDKTDGYINPSDVRKRINEELGFTALSARDIHKIYVDILSTTLNRK